MLKRIAELWGNFEALGVNADHKRDCEKVSILITTTQIKKIEEVIELEVGEKIVEVGVVELGFLESTAIVENRKPKADFGCNKGTNKDESTYDSSSKQAKMGTTKVDRCCSETEEKALNAMWADKENNNSVNRDLEKSRGLFNEEELMGGKSKETNANGVIVGNQKGLESGNGHIEIVVGPNGNVPPIVEIMANTTSIGVQVSGPNPIVQPRSNSWAAVLDENYNHGVSLVDEDVELSEAHSEGETTRFHTPLLSRLELKDYLFFRVHGALAERLAGCGGVLRTKDGILRALFSGPVEEISLSFAFLAAVKIALVMFRETGWVGKGSSVIRRDYSSKESYSIERASIVGLSWSSTSKQTVVSVLVIQGMSCFALQMLGAWNLQVL
ncbi:hypothetical protein V6N13_056136 [Hibiscus sabdariffa]